jgi:regulator of sirC expression with transglutaminase-like and TPR domain
MQLRTILLGTFLACLACPVACAADRIEPGYLLAGLEEIEKAFPNLAHGDLQASVTRLAADLPADLDTRDARQAIGLLNALFFHRTGIVASQDLDDLRNLIPSSVLERRTGYCVGVAALYLLVAERLDLPLHAVATPSHVFVRWESDSARVNIETLQGGAEIPDEQYMRDQKIGAVSVRHGVFLRSLTPRQFLAQFHSNIGVVYSKQKDFARAALEYRTAFDLDARLPAAYYNYGNDRLLQGDFRAAVRLFTRGLRHDPTDVWALNNRGVASLRQGHRDRARKDFQAALAIDEAFGPARQNLDDLTRAAGGSERSISP